MRKLELNRYDDGVEIHLPIADAHMLTTILYDARMGFVYGPEHEPLIAELEEKLDAIVNEKPEVNRIIRISDSWVVEINDSIIKLYEKSMIGHYVAALVLDTERVLLNDPTGWTIRHTDLDKMFEE